MAVGETFLKTSDYPFIYSISTIALGLIGGNITNNTLTILGITGFFGTLLTITDPIGNIVRKHMQGKFVNIITSENGKNTLTRVDYQISAIKTRAIGIEVDKIVSIVYFTLATILFAFAMTSDTFAQRFLLYGEDQKPVFDLSQVKLVGGLVSVGVAFYLNFYTGRKWISELYDKIKVAGIHQLAISSEYATANSVENMSRSIEQGDWITSKKWGEKIEYEINHKKGKKDVIIKGIEKVYRPLHKESLSIEERCNQVATGRPYPYLNTDEWRNIGIESDYVILEDKSLLQHIGEFHGKIQDYDYLLGICSNKINEIILKRASAEFGKKIQRIEYFTDKVGGDSHFRLIDCAMLGVHPKDKYQGTPAFVDLNFINDTTGNSENYKTPPAELKIFDAMWEKVLSDVEKNESVIKLKKLFPDIQSENIELKQKYFEKMSEELNL